MMKEFERRIVRLETLLDSSRGPETLEEMLAAFERGKYSQTSLMEVVVSILANGGTADHLRGGELPDKLLDFVVEQVRNTMANSDESSGRLPEKGESDSL